MIIIYKNKIVYCNDNCWYHNLYGPAIEHANGDKEWWINGKRHRIDGPAIEYAKGDKFWYINGERHRTNGPAVEYSNGSRYWWKNNLLHNENGPAIEYADGRKEWWILGKNISQTEYLEMCVEYAISWHKYSSFYDYCRRNQKL